MYGVRQIARDTLGILAFAVVLALISWRTYQRLPAVNQPRDPVRNAMCDFRDVVYFPARAAAAGVNPYDSHPRPDGRGYRDLYPAGNPFPLYGPLVLVVSLPFAFLPLPVAQVVFWLLNVVLLLVLARVALRICGIEANVGLVTGLAALLLLSRPGHANLHFGQITLPMILATMGAWRLSERLPTASGMLLALALIKPTFGVPLALLMLSCGRFRAALIGLAITAVVSAAIMAALVARDTGGPGIVELLSKNQTALEDDPNVHPRLSGSRIDVPMVVEKVLGEDVALLARWVLPLLILGVSGWNLRKLDSIASHSDTVNLSALGVSFVCITIAICIYHGIYDGLLATVPAVAAWHGVLRQGTLLPTRWNLPLAICLSVPALNYFSSKQFLATLAETFPAAFAAGSPADGIVWAVLCIVNGVSLGIAWWILLHAVRSEAHRRV